MPEDIFARRDGDRALVFDARWFPLVWLTWWGEANEELGRAVFELYAPYHRQIKDTQTPHILVSDNRLSTRPPATVRRQLSELTDAVDPEVRELSLGVMLVINDPVVRGAATAVQWLTPWDLKFAAFADLKSALKRAETKLVRAGVRLPPAFDPETLEAPPMPDAGGQTQLG